MEVKIDDKQYQVNCVLNSNLKTFENVSKTLNDDKLEYADKIVYVIKELSDIPIDILEIADLEQLQELFNQITKFEFDKENYKIINEVDIDGVKYITPKSFEKFEDIKLNRSQHKTIKKFIENGNNYVAAIMTCYFTEDGNQLIEENENFHKRLALFNEKMELNVAIPYITKVIQTVATQMGQTIESFQQQ